ncbi:MAG: glycosyltransferase [Rikenellaceae bacterium]
MRLVFVTNTLNHHQIAVADEFYRSLGDNYRFIATLDFVDPKGGLESYSDRPYLICSYEGEDAMREAIDLINEADVVIIGSSPDSLIKQRLQSNLLTFRYGERWLKRRYKLLDYPRKFVAHTLNRGRNLYFLAASAFLANDMKYLFAYPNKCFRWGYFTNVEDIDIDSILSRKRDSRGRGISMMWCSRFVAWKHPELPIKLAQRLKRDGYDFHIDMYGEGTELSKIETLAEKLGVSDVVTFKGGVSNNQVVQAMRGHHIFLLTSDRNEGWGVVLNEAMSNGCVAVSSHMVGAAPYLITDKFNGRLFESGSVESLYSTVKELIVNRDLCDLYAKRAYTNMREVWSAQNAVKQFISLAESLLNKGKFSVAHGPCSIDK